MNILLLGGTRFLGRHVAEQALAAGHALTLLHRGRSARGLFPQARHLLADRDADLSVLDGSQTWDAVIDTSAYVPRQVRAVAARLAGRVRQYQMVSTISVYAEPQTNGADESAPLAVLADPAAEVLSGATYGALKALCERAAVEAFGQDRVLLPRPGLIVGPHDPTGRFSWWVQRLQRGGDVLAPGPADAPVQFIDVRDLAAWLLAQAARGSAGAYNLTGPLAPMTMQALLEAAGRVLSPMARLRWADGDWLLAEGVQPWMELPLWLPPGQAKMMTVDVARAVAAGLQCRPLEQTLRDTAAWLASSPPAPAAGAIARPPAGMAVAVENRLLAMLAQR